MMMEKKSLEIRKDLNDMATSIEFKKIKTKYNERNVAVVTLFNGEVVEFKDTEGLYDLFNSFRKIGKKDFLVSKKLVEELRSSSEDVSSDEVDEATGTYVCVLFELANGKKYRLFPARKFVDREIIDNYYWLFKEKQKQAKQNQSK